MTHTDETPDNLEAMAKQLIQEFVSTPIPVRDKIFTDNMYDNTNEEILISDTAISIALKYLRTAHAQGAASTPIADDVKGLAVQCVNALFGDNECMKDIGKVNIETIASIIQAFIDSRTGWFRIDDLNNPPPKDGTPFIAYWVRKYSSGERYEAAQPYVVAHFMGGRLFPSWIDKDDMPTHWVSLDALPPPSAGKGE